MGTCDAFRLMIPDVRNIVVNINRVGVVLLINYCEVLRLMMLEPSGRPVKGGGSGK